MPMDPSYESPGHLPGDSGDPGARANYLETQEEHLEDMQIEREKEIGTKWTKNKGNGANTGMNDNNNDDDKNMKMKKSASKQTTGTTT